MKATKLIQTIAEKETQKEAIAAKIARDPDRLREVVAGLDAKEPAVKYGCAKVLRLAVQEAPEFLYPFIGRFIELIDSPNKILKWEALHLLGRLACVDQGGKIDALLERYLAPIPGPDLITAANAIHGAGLIAEAKPHLADRIARALVKCAEGSYKTEECRNVAIGHAITAFDRFFDQVSRKKPIVALVKNQLENSRNSTRKKAEQFLKKRGL